jgi:hypothetical protein
MNGSVKMIDSLVEQLNNAKLDGTTGTSDQSIYTRPGCHCTVVNTR